MGSKKYYGIIDTETATIPQLKAIMGDKAGLNCPLIYDIGLVIQDREGVVFHAQQWIVSEIYSRPEVFATAYYAYKRPLYTDLIKRGQASVQSWSTVKMEILLVMERFKVVSCAYNAQFDFKKAFNSTNRFVSAVYKSNSAEEVQKMVDRIVDREKTNVKYPTKKDEVAQFWLVDKWFPVIDIWNFACLTIFQSKAYKQMALENGWYSEAKNFKTNAEVAYRFITNQPNYIEEHTALEDAKIEGEILAYCLKHRGAVKIPYGIAVNPWQKVGKAIIPN